MKDKVIDAYKIGKGCRMILKVSTVGLIVRKCNLYYTSYALPR